MEQFVTFLSTCTLKQVVDFIVGIVAVLSVVVEFSKKIPFHPWSFILSYIGKALTKDLYKKVEEIEAKQDTNIEALNELKHDVDDKFKDVDKRFNEVEKNSDTKEAKRLRARIIDFADRCRSNQRFTKTSFDNISRDYDDYISYCDRHNIPNHFIDAEYKYIKEVYLEKQRNNDFL